MMTPRPTAAILNFLTTLGNAQGVVGIPEDEASFLRDLDAVLTYLRDVEQDREGMRRALELAEDALDDWGDDSQDGLIAATKAISAVRSALGREETMQ